MRADPVERILAPLHHMLRMLSDPRFAAVRKRYHKDLCNEAVSKAIDEHIATALRARVIKRDPIA